MESDTYPRHCVVHALKEIDLAVVVCPFESSCGNVFKDIGAVPGRRRQTYNCTLFPCIALLSNDAINYYQIHVLYTVKAEELKTSSNALESGASTSRGLDEGITYSSIHSITYVVH